MKPDDELAALWFHLEPMCAEVEPPSCYTCSGITELVPPEYLYYVCKACYPESFSWEFLSEDV